MNVQMDKDWLRKFEDDDGNIEEPGGVMACSPFLYSWMTASQYAAMFSAVNHIVELSLLEYQSTYHRNEADEDRFIWMMNRAIRYAERLIRSAKMPC